MNKFDVYNYLLKIPQGMVSTYSNIAKYYNSKAYQAIGQILHANNDSNIPCYKIVNKDGNLSKNYKFGGPLAQKARLLNDGITFIDNRVDLNKHLFTLILETDRLYLRLFNDLDIKVLEEMMNDKVMYYYEHHFTKEDILEWYLRQKERYLTGYGLLACCLKETDEVIGQIGLTKQQIPGKEVIELGYIFSDKFWGCGYATEAGKALIEKAFNNGINEVYSIIKYNNYKSQNVAIRNDMEKVGEFVKVYKGINMPHFIYRVTK